MRVSDQLDEFVEPSLFDAARPEELEASVDETDPDQEDVDDEPEGTLGDFEELVPDLFKVWADGSEYAAAEYAWSTLAKLGLTDYDDEVGQLVWPRKGR